MATSRRGGGVTKRCECRGPDGKRLGAKCPKLKSRKHGRFEIHQELPDDADGNRRRFRRTGYPDKDEAEGDLERIRTVLKLATDDDERRRVGDLLAGLMTTRAPIPEPAEVSKRLGVGVPLDGKTTLGEWLDTWLASKKTKRKTTTGYESHVRVWLKPHLGHYRLDRLSVSAVQEFFDSIDDRNETIRAENAARREQQARCRWGRNGRPSDEERTQLEAERAKLAEMPPYRRTTGHATKQRIRATLRAALNKAIARQMGTFNAAAHVELDSGKRPKAKLWTAEHVARLRETGEKPSAVMVWAPAQIGAFLDAAEESRLYALFHLIAFRGLRRGEAVGQNWADVDLGGQQLTVSKEIVVDGWTPVEDDPKTDGSAGVIGLDSVSVQVLREHRARQLAERDAWNERAAREREEGKKTADWKDTGKVFGQGDGSWLHPETVSDEFRKIVAAADLPPINLRDLRHCAATLIHRGGGDMHVIKEVLRHSTIRLASDTYTSLLKEVDLEVAERAATLVPRARRGDAVEVSG